MTSFYVLCKPAHTSSVRHQARELGGRQHRRHVPRQEVRQLRLDLSSRNHWRSLLNLSRQLLGELEAVKEQNPETDLIKFLQNSQRDADVILEHMPMVKKILNPTDVWPNTAILAEVGEPTPLPLLKLVQ